MRNLLASLAISLALFAGLRLAYGKAIESTFGQGNITTLGNITTGNITATALTLSGELDLKSYTTTQLVTLVPTAVGALVFESVNNNTCESTGTAAGSWVLVGSTSTALGTGTKVRCW